jgi:hypothetical protein
MLCAIRSAQQAHNKRTRKHALISSWKNTHLAPAVRAPVKEMIPAT